MSNGLRVRSIGIKPTQFVTTPRHGKRKAAEIAQLCGSLLRRHGSLSPDFYMGAVRHLVDKFIAMSGNENGGLLRGVLGGETRTRPAINECMSSARAKGDTAAQALGRLLLTLTDEQLEAL